MNAMIDFVEPIDVPASDTTRCPRCETEFAPKRKNQKFCSRDCQKASSRNTSRGSRRGESKGRNALHYQRAHDLAEMIYSEPPSQRLGVMKDILAHIEHDAGLRNILTDPKLLKEPPRASNRMNIAKAANAYTQKFFGLSIKVYLERARQGKLPADFAPTKGPVDHGPVPCLKGKLTKKNVKCWHKPLAQEVSDSSEGQFNDDMKRVSRIVAEVQARLAPAAPLDASAAADF